MECVGRGKIVGSSSICYNPRVVIHWLARRCVSSHTLVHLARRCDVLWDIESCQTLIDFPIRSGAMVRLKRSGDQHDKVASRSNEGSIELGSPVGQSMSELLSE